MKGRVPRGRGGAEGGQTGQRAGSEQQGGVHWPDLSGAVGQPGRVAGGWHNPPTFQVPFPGPEGTLPWGTGSAEATSFPPLLGGAGRPDPGSTHHALTL